MTSKNKVFHHEITEILENSPAKFKLCIADACHSGSLYAEKGGMRNAFESYYQALAQSKPGMASNSADRMFRIKRNTPGRRRGTNIPHELI